MSAHKQTDRRKETTVGLNTKSNTNWATDGLQSTVWC